MIRLDFQAQDLPLVLKADRVDGKTQRLDYSTCKDLLAIFRTPYHMLCRLVHTIAVVYDF